MRIQYAVDIHHLQFRMPYLYYCVNKERSLLMTEITDIQQKRHHRRALNVILTACEKDTSLPLSTMNSWRGSGCLKGNVSCFVECVLPLDCVMYESAWFTRVLTVRIERRCDSQSSGHGISVIWMSHAIDSCCGNRAYDIGWQRSDKRAGAPKTLPSNLHTPSWS